MPVALQGRAASPRPLPLPPLSGGAGPVPYCSARREGAGSAGSDLSGGARPVSAGRWWGTGPAGKDGAEPVRAPSPGGDVLRASAHLLPRRREAPRRPGRGLRAPRNMAAPQASPGPRGRRPRRGLGPGGAGGGSGAGGALGV